MVRLMSFMCQGLWAGDLHRVFCFWHMVANRLLTLISNMFSDLNLTYMETCYKVFKKIVLEKIEIEENRFGFEPEITAKIGELAKENNVAIYEVGISYYGRSYGEGKKIGLKDAFRALWCIFKYNTSALQVEKVHKTHSHPEGSLTSK